MCRGAGRCSSSRSPGCPASSPPARGAPGAPKPLHPETCCDAQPVFPGRQTHTVCIKKVLAVCWVKHPSEERLRGVTAAVGTWVHWHRQTGGLSLPSGRELVREAVSRMPLRAPVHHPTLHPLRPAGPAKPSVRLAPQQGFRSTAGALLEGRATLTRGRVCPGPSARRGEQRPGTGQALSFRLELPLRRSPATASTAPPARLWTCGCVRRTESFCLR